MRACLRTSLAIGSEGFVGCGLSHQAVAHPAIGPGKARDVASRMRRHRRALVRDHRARQHHEAIAAIVVIHEHRCRTVRRRDQPPAHQAIARTRQVRQLHRLLQAVRHPLHQLRAVGRPHLDRPDPVRRIDAVGVSGFLRERGKSAGRALQAAPHHPATETADAQHQHRCDRPPDRRGPSPPALDDPLTD